MPWSQPFAITAWNWRLILPFNARPTIPGSPSTLTGSSFVLTAPSSTQKIHRRSIRTSTRSTSSPPTGAACGKLCAMSSLTGFAATCASSASTTRTPRLCRSGSGASARSTRNIQTSSFSPKPSPGRTSCTQLAKAGFTQSYTYFTWRNTKDELQEYFEEITKPPISDFFRPNLWPNTPDILHAALQTGGRPAFMQRLILAATLGANYGIYGPAFELSENVPIQAGKRRVSQQ